MSTQQEPINFDILIVYGTNAKSANDSEYTGDTPFPAEEYSFIYNPAYQYFLEYSQKQGLRAAFTTIADVSGAGTFSSAWVYDKGWKRLLQPVYSRAVYDKYSTGTPENKEMDDILMQNVGEVRLFHSRKIRNIFNDKLKTFQKLKNFCIPTVNIECDSVKQVQQAKRKLHEQVNSHDAFDATPETYILKDQFGAGGYHIYKVQKDRKLLALGKEHDDISFVLQPLIQASGFTFTEYEGILDLRVIVNQGKVIQSYIRIPKEGDFRANVQQGGDTEYIDPKILPRAVKRMVKNIDKRLPEQDTFYAIDFIKSANGHIYLVEGNITPGIYWSDEEEEVKTKYLIDVIVNSMQASL